MDAWTREDANDLKWLLAAGVVVAALMLLAGWRIGPTL